MTNHEKRTQGMIWRHEKTSFFVCIGKTGCGDILHEQYTELLIRASLLLVSIELVYSFGVLGSIPANAVLFLHWGHQKNEHVPSSALWSPLGSNRWQHWKHAQHAKPGKCSKHKVHDNSHNTKPLTPRIFGATGAPGNATASPWQTSHGTSEHRLSDVNETLSSLWVEYFGDAILHKHEFLARNNWASFCSAL